MTKNKELEKRMEKIHIAVLAQVNDETLWCTNESEDGELKRKPKIQSAVTIGEAYVQQSLTWLHEVIEFGDDRALKNIIDQSNGDV